MSWYNAQEIHLAAPNSVRSSIYKGTDGRDYLSLPRQPATFPLRTQIQQLGFRWDGNQWYAAVDDLNRNPNARNTLSGWGVVLPVSRSNPQAPQPPRQPSQPIEQLGPQTPQAPTEPEAPQKDNWYGQSQTRNWYLARLVSDNTPVVVAKGQVGEKGWVWQDEAGATGKFADEEVKGAIKSVRDENGKPYTSTNPQELFAILKETEAPLAEDERQNVGNMEGTPSSAIVTTEQRIAGMIPEHKMSAEQRSIDEAFAKTQDSIMIDALAGSGKTTMLKHLAWKYGDENQNWLYMVFNTKNKVEAKQKFPTTWVKVATTNSFLGNVLSHAAKKGLIPATQRMKQIEPKGVRLKKSEQVPDKTELLVDGAQFLGMSRQHGLLPKPGWESKIAHMQAFHQDRIRGLLETIRNNFGKACIQLTSLCKAFAVDPRKPELPKQIENVLAKYDVDHDMLELKERIGKYREPLRTNCIQGLSAVLGYDFMTRSFKNECIQAVQWMLKECLPGACKQTFNYRGQPYNLGQYRDFDDDLWFTAINADKMDWRMGQPKGFTHVLADEVQDFNECQKIALARMKGLGSKVVAVGDPNQCQPAGTMISLSNGTQKPIEMLQVGEEVVTYNSKKSYFPGTKSQGRKIEEVASREYTGEVIKISTDKYSHECTPNHRCLVRFNGNGKYCVYLMQKGTAFRIGFCRLNYFEKFGLVGRCLSEKADNGWVLGIYDTESEARKVEAVTAFRFGIPLTLFTNRNTKKPDFQQLYDAIFSSMGNLTANAERCLSSFGRMMEFPLWSKEQHERHGILKQSYIGTKKSFITQACNLIDGCMQVRTFDGNNRGGEWANARISREIKTCTVYSLKVEPTEGGRRLYIANNIVTHNSLYRFRGADASAFSNIATLLGSQKHNLSYNFRSLPAIIDYSNANTHVKNLKSGLKIDPAKLEEFLTDPKMAESAEDMAWIQSAKEVVGANFDTNTIKTAIDQGKLKWPPALAGKATYQKKEYDNLFKEIAAERQAGKSVSNCFISRTNAPLANAALQCLTQSLPFVIVGKDIAGDLIEHINTLASARMKNGLGPLNNDSPLTQLYEKLNSYLDDQIQQHGNKASKRGFLQDLSDITSALSSAIQQFDNQATTLTTEDNNYVGIDTPVSSTAPTGEPAAPAVKTIGAFKKWLGEKLGGLDLEQNEDDILKYMEEVENNKKNPPVVLTTSHKSKGLEWDRVFVLRDDLFPHPKASRQEDLAQEANAKYVTYTRAMKELHIVKLEGQPGYQKK